MILERGDMFDVWGKTDMFLITTNPIVNKNGEAVMGRGIAKQMADKLPTIRKDFGQALRSWNRSRYPYLYAGYIGWYDPQRVGYFMTKDHWMERAKLDVIQRATDSLVHWMWYALEEGEGFERIDLNFPGIGNGRLNREKVLPIIEELPDEVHVWEYGN